MKPRILFAVIGLISATAFVRGNSIDPSMSETFGTLTGTNEVDATSNGTDPGPYLGLTFEADSSGNQETYFEEFSVPASPEYTLTVGSTVSSGESVTLSNADYFISESYIPLDQLNFGATPPTYDGSPFTPLPDLDGKTLTPGGSISADVATPLPSSAAGMLVLLGALIIYKRINATVQ